MLSVCSGDDRQHTAEVRSAIERWYWLHPVAVPAYLDRRLLVRNGAFLLGWKRLHA